MKKLIPVLIILISASLLMADQAAWITKEQAGRGAALIRKSGVIKHYCEPCGDSFYRTEYVSTSVAVKAVGSDAGDPYYEVRVNGKGVDLAYVYLLSGDRWVNAAMLLDIEVTGVPENLPGDLRDENSDCR